MEIKPVSFTPPASNEFPALFKGFIAVGFAGGRWWSGCDENSDLDAYHAMQDEARRGLLTAAQVEIGFDPGVFPHTVRIFWVNCSDEAPSIFSEPLPDSI